jgi:hypothetical protein
VDSYRISGGPVDEEREDPVIDGADKAGLLESCAVRRFLVVRGEPLGPLTVEPPPLGPGAPAFISPNEDGRSDKAIVRGDLSDNAGAYLRAPEPASIVRTISSYGGPYRVRSVLIHARSVMTNKGPVGLNRGYGGQQHCFGLERIVDLAAERLGLDPTTAPPGR